MMPQLATLRAEMVKAVNLRKTGLLPPSFSVLEILYVLRNHVLTPDDDFVMSKGHAGLGLYAIDGQLDDFKAGKLAGLTTYGSLGHGLSTSIGLAVNRPAGRVFCLIGDGESNEGSVWEAARYAAEQRLPIVAILDCNGTHNGAHYGQVFEAWGWKPYHVDGHNIEALMIALRTAEPLTCIVARTVKGKGCKRMEDDPQAWHNRVPNDKETFELVNELTGGKP